ncbi:MAG: SurA N-terminal domain-containing protein [Acidobacteriota bacterium]|nr:SurA N-terminal domain-containing protein [Acidobacteriota bacterium]
MRTLGRAIALAAAVFAAGSAAADVVDRIAATLDDVAIPESDVRKAMAVSAIAPEPGEDTAAHRRRVLDALIDQRLQYREALRFGPAVPDAAELDAALKKLRERLQSEGRDPAAEFAAAGMTPEDVRASLARQLVVQNYLQERFRPIAIADEERAREEYDTRYTAERRAAGAPVEPFESVAEEMRRRSQQRVFNEEAERWMREIRQKARIAIYKIALPIGEGRNPIPLPTPPRPLSAAPVSAGPSTRIPQ